MNRDIARSLGLNPKLNEDAVPTIDVANVQAAPTEMTCRERKQVRVFLNHFRPMTYNASIHRSCFSVIII